MIKSHVLYRLSYALTLQFEHDPRANAFRVCHEGKPASRPRDPGAALLVSGSCSCPRCVGGTPRRVNSATGRERATGTIRIPLAIKAFSQAYSSGLRPATSLLSGTVAAPASDSGATDYPQHIHRAARKNPLILADTCRAQIHRPVQLSHSRAPLPAPRPVPKKPFSCPQETVFAWRESRRKRSPAQHRRHWSNNEVRSCWCS
jgi:hypothetical protein